MYEIMENTTVQPDWLAPHSWGWPYREPPSLALAVAVVHVERRAGVGGVAGARVAAAVVGLLPRASLSLSADII